MFTKLIAALLGLSTLPSAAQTTTQPVTPTVANGNISVSIPDSSGALHIVTLPYVVTLTVGTGTDTYTPPVPPPPPPPPPPSGAPAIPSTATAVSLITQGTWKPCEHDAGTPGTGTCANSYPVTGIFADSARGFSMSYTGAGGVRWANSFAKDTTSTNFVLDAVVQSPDWTHVADLELDTNQVKADGKTAILGTQCASQEKTWDITLSDSTGAWHWVRTNVACNPLTWTPNVPHHIRIFGQISAQDISTYLGVEFDGVYTAFNAATGSTADALHWGVGTVLDNVQIDGFGASGSATVYMDKLTIYRW